METTWKWARALGQAQEKQSPPPTLSPRSPLLVAVGMRRGGLSAWILSPGPLPHPDCLPLCAPRPISVTWG